MEKRPVTTKQWIQVLSAFVVFLNTWLVVLWRYLIIHHTRKSDTESAQRLRTRAGVYCYRLVQLVAEVVQMLILLDTSRNPRMKHANLLW